MNPTDEYLLEAFKQQGVVNDAMIAEIREAVEAQPEEEVGDKDLSFMNLVLEKTGTAEHDVVNFLASELNMEAVDLSQVNPSEEIVALLTPEWARKYEAFPLGLSGAEIEIVFGNPLDEDGLDNLTHLLGKTIYPKIAYRGAVLHAIDESYGSAEDRKMNEFFDGMDSTEIEIGDGVKPEDVSEEDAPIIKYVHSVIKDALEMRASDIHMEPLEKKFRIRFRVDGKLQEQQDPPKRLQPSIISRTKLMANVSLAEKRVPLDGRINVKVGDKVIDLRVSTLPTVHGESIVMRILDKESLSLGLPQLGFFSDDQEVFEDVISMPDGIFLVTGPTGSGKSTTIKVLLGLLNPSRGVARIFGRSPRDVKTKERIGYLPEESYLYRYLNSAETLDFFGGLFALDGEEKKRRSEQLLEMVGLKGVQMRTVGEFSKGMQRRIGLAQALINDPDLVILDEPTAGMDPVGCREIKDLILNLKGRGKTVILSSHLLADVEDVCDRAVIYYGGKVQQYGTLEELLTERDSVQFTVPTLSETAQKEVLEVIGRHVDRESIRVDISR